MRPPVILPLVAAAAAIIRIANAADTCTPGESNVDFFGGDIANAQGQPNDCCGQCLARSGCAAYTWSDYLGGTCWLKSSTGTRTNTAGRISAVVVPDAQCGQTFPNTDFFGDDVGNTKGQYKDCCGACRGFQGCTAWTWSDYLGGTCWLKKGTGNRVNAAGKISGLLPSPTCESDALPPNTDILDNDIGNKLGKASECCDICKGFKGCVAWAWNDYQSGTCWLKSAVGALVSKNGVTSGKLRGTPPPKICTGQCLRGNYPPNGLATAPAAPPCWITESGGYFSCFDYVNGKCPWPQETDCGFKRLLRVI